MRIVHVLAGRQAWNGIAVLAEGFARAQEALGHSVRLVRFSPRAVAAADLVQVHGSWTWPVWAGVLLAVLFRKKLIVTPSGSYDPVRLAYHAWKKCLAAPVDRWCLRRADLVQATSAAEVAWIRAFEPRVKQIAVVPPGQDLPPLPSALPAPSATVRAQKRLLYLGRRHPLKGLDILEAAAQGLPLELDVQSHVFGEEKEAHFAACDALCLPSLSENFGLVVAEALARGKPVVVTDATPWEGVEAHRCGWCARGFAAPETPRPARVESLRRALAAFCETPRTACAAMGARGRVWICRDFAWARAARKLLRALAQTTSPEGQKMV